MHTRVALRAVKCHPKFNLVEGSLSRGAFCRTPCTHSIAIMMEYLPSKEAMDDEAAV